MVNLIDDKKFHTQMYKNMDIFLIEMCPFSKKNNKNVLLFYLIAAIFCCWKIETFWKQKVKIFAFWMNVEVDGCMKLCTVVIGEIKNSSTTI